MLLMCLLCYLVERRRLVLGVRCGAVWCCGAAAAGLCTCCVMSCDDMQIYF
nr:MAG TPA: hypothetical protein [Caudoviricetes sp.]